MPRPKRPRCCLSAGNVDAGRRESIDGARRPRHRFPSVELMPQLVGAFARARGPAAIAPRKAPPRSPCVDSRPRRRACVFREPTSRSFQDLRPALRRRLACVRLVTRHSLPAAAARSRASDRSPALARRASRPPRGFLPLHCRGGGRAGGLLVLSHALSNTHWVTSSQGRSSVHRDHAIGARHEGVDFGLDQLPEVGSELGEPANRLRQRSEIDRRLAAHPVEQRRHL